LVEKIRGAGLLGWPSPLHGENPPSSNLGRSTKGIMILQCKKCSTDFQVRKADECERCGWKEVPEILRVHHLDRDRSNNALENLEILCSICHDKEHYFSNDGLWWKKGK
jgi:DNA-directed RNA polymerase subunit M/transcription elongation factor TFIIS